MKKKYLLIGIAFVAFMFTLASCKKDEESKTAQYSDLNASIKSLISENAFNTIAQTGMPMYKGTTPPNFENTYLVSPFTLKSSNIPSDYTSGTQFADFIVKYSNQNTSSNTIKLSFVNGPESGSAIGGYVSGAGNLFTVYTKIEVFDATYGDVAEVALITSGEWTSTGIKNFYYANFMLDNNGNVYEYFIDNNQGRVFYDGDAMSEITDNYVLKSAVQAFKAGCQK